MLEAPRRGAAPRQGADDATRSRHSTEAWLAFIFALCVIGALYLLAS